MTFNITVLHFFLLLTGSALYCEEFICWKTLESIIGKTEVECSVLPIRLEEASWHSYRGVSLLGNETLKVCVDKANKNSTNRDIYIFRHGKLVCVEKRYSYAEIENKKLKESILRPAISHFDFKSSSRHYYKTGSTSVKGWLFMGKKSVAVVAVGDFKDNPELSWIKIRMFCPQFFNFRNQHQFWPNDYGQERILLR